MHTVHSVQRDITSRQAHKEVICPTLFLSCPFSFKTLAEEEEGNTSRATQVARTATHAQSMNQRHSSDLAIVRLRVFYAAACCRKKIIIIKKKKSINKIGIRKGGGSAPVKEKQQHTIHCWPVYVRWTTVLKEIKKASSDPFLFLVERQREQRPLALPVTVE